jgi:phospholipid/cholesterol/gamma-HCH transport system substrate-binding protein
MENKSHALVAGVFTLLLGIALALAAMWLSRDKAERVPYELVTRASVSGLAVQAAVRYRGLDVGKVEQIRFDPAVPGQILVRIGVDVGTPITASTYATLGYQGVTGLAYVQLDDDGKSTAPLSAKDGQIARIDIKPGLLDKLAGKGEAILTELEETAKRVNQLLGPDNQKLFSETLASARDAANELRTVSGKLTPTLSALPKAVAEAQATLITIRGASQDFAAVARRLNDKDGTLDRLSLTLDQVGQAADSFNVTSGAVNRNTLPRWNNLADDASRSARAITRSASALGDNPQTLLFGTGPIPPGPGEPGFAASK